MSKSKQFQEPWTQSNDIGDDIAIEDDEGFVIFRCKSGKPVGLNLHSPKRLAAFRRTIDCVNACAGINPEAVPDMLEALESTYNIIMQNRALGLNQGSEYVHIVDHARAAIAKAKKKD